MTDELVIVDVEQGTAEWHALRDAKVRTASRTPLLMGTSKFGGPPELYDILTTEELRDEGFSKRIRDFGNRTEPRARAALELKLGFEGAPVVGYRGEYLASLDFWDHDGINVDVKCPYSGEKSKTWQAALRGAIEPGYADQLEHQHNVFGAYRSFLFVYLDDERSILLPYEPRPQRWGEIRRAWDDFMANLGAGVRPQEYDSRTDDAWQVAASEFAAAKAALDAAEKRADEAKKALAKLAGGRKTHGFGVRVNVYPKQGLIDWQACAKALDPAVDGEPFRAEGRIETKVELIKPKGAK